MLYNPIDATLVDIMIGKSTEIDPTLVHLLTISRDTTNYILGSQSWKFSMSGAVTGAYALWDPMTPTDPLAIGPISRIYIGIYLPAGTASKLTQFQIYLYMDAGCTKYFYNSATGGFVDGWNYLNCTMNNVTVSDITSWGNIYQTEIILKTSAAVDISVQVWGYTWPKGKILFMSDYAMQDFVDNMYPQLKARSLPVEFAIDPTDLGIISDRITWETLESLMNDGNQNAITFHGYNHTTDDIDNLTDAGCLSSTLKALESMASHGYFNPMWRGAFLQNTAIGHAGIDDLFPAYATYHGATNPENWPSYNMHDINRIALHGESSAQIDDIFTRLQYSHNLYILYTHKCTSAGSSTDTSYAQRDYFLSKVDTGLAVGWLEFTTFSKLATELGWYWAIDPTTRQRYIATPILDGSIVKYYQPTYRRATSTTRNPTGSARSARS